MLHTIAALVVLAAPAADAPSLKVVQAKLDKKVARQAQYTQHVEKASKDDDCGGFTYAASSTLAPAKRLHFDPKNLNDGLLGSAWCEGGPGYGVGQSFTITLDANEGHPAWTGRVEIMNGNAGNAKLFQKSGRIKALKVSLNDKPIATVQLQDALGLQTFELGEALGKDAQTRGGVIKFEIAEVYSDGAQSEDTCVSEIRPAHCVP
ncbi:MAG: hypothetical protein JST54_20940 [Deltaproteobacteria bacterium]|nr:hypothetical protein [Deltaproteobacteria bacterium]